MDTTKQIKNDAGTIAEVIEAVQWIRDRGQPAGVVRCRETGSLSTFELVKLTEEGVEVYDVMWKEELQLTEEEKEFDPNPEPVPCLEQVIGKDRLEEKYVTVIGLDEPLDLLG